jgi:hypothetical protein
MTMGVSARVGSARTAVLVGQHQVEHHQVGALAADDMKSSTAFVSRKHLEASLFQIGPHQSYNLFVIVHDEDALAHDDFS